MAKSFTQVVHEQYTRMAKNELFIVEVDDLFAKYLAAFPPGTDPIYRTKSYHDCSCCKQFIRTLGRVVNIKEGKVITVWDDLKIESPYKEVFSTLGDIVRNSPIKGVFRTKERSFGVEYNYDEDGERYEHFHGKVSEKHYSTKPDTIRSELDAIFQVCYRGLTEIKLGDIETVLDLIQENQLYRGEEHKPSLIGFRDLLRKSKALKDENSVKRFVWENLENRNARFRNTVIGTLLVDLADGKDLEQAVKSFESKVAPMNYKRPSTIITQKMVENAVQTLTDLGLGGAIYRRFARFSDVSVNDVLFVDNKSQGKMKDGVTKLLESSIQKATPNLKNATPITAENFVKEVVPNSKTLDLFLENRHVGNFVSLTGGDGPERLFKWNNNFAWSYDGEVTDSVKQRVKAAGGNINCKLRVSLSWFNFDDLDLHCVTPNKEHIYFHNKASILDVDMNAGYGKTRTPVENLAFQHLQDGIYKVYVNQYSQREKVDVGFAIEVECGGVLHQYSYPKALRTGENVECFNLTIKSGVLLKIDTSLTGGNVSKEKWGVKTETLVPVTALMNSPNHWGDQAIGAKHLIFSLEGCRNPESTRGIYNEFLRGDLDKHRKVFEVLASKTKVPYSDDQISGVGFTTARGDSVTVLVDGKRPYHLTF